MMHSVFKELFKNFKELEIVISNIVSSKDKGDAFEDFAFLYFILHSELYNIKNVYKSDNIPDDLRKKYKLEKKDYGVDGLIITKDNLSIAYQVKFRTDNKYANYSELSTFWSESEYCDKRCIFSNSVGLPFQAYKKKEQFSILLSDFYSLGSDFFLNIYEKYNATSLTVKKKFSPKVYQEKIITETIEGFKSNNRGKIIAACGTGKTLNSLWIKERLSSKSTLFVVPSLALIKQTLSQWLQHTNNKFVFLCVCSDQTITNDIDDQMLESTSLLNFPVTTAPVDIIRFLSNQTEDEKVIFSTYHSLDAIVTSLMELNDFFFDLAVFDEAHRTAGTKDSYMFTLGMKDEYIPIKKRLFMTATERLVSTRVKKAISETEYEIFSMDDIDLYGPTFSSLSFGKAIEDGIICDYKILLTAITNDELSLLLQENYYIGSNLGTRETSNELMKKILLAKSINEYNIRKIISYHKDIKSSKSFVFGNDSTSFEHILENFMNLDELNYFFNHVNGSMNSAMRSDIFDKFSQSDVSLLTNAKCLTEGIDLPMIDAVMFSDPKNSVIDIIQAIGRALRKPLGIVSKTSYIILPIIVDTSIDSFKNINPEAFETLHNVIQALRDQDHRLAEEIDKLNLQLAKTGRVTKPYGSLTNLEVNVPSKFNLDDFYDGLSIRIAEINKDTNDIKPQYKLTEGKKGRRSGIKRVFRTIGDYNVNSYEASLVIPTFRLFSSIGSSVPSKELSINHNNVSHCVKLGIIEKTNSDEYSITNIGKAFYSNKIMFNELFKNQILKYSDYNSDVNKVIFPYRAFFKIMLEFDSITKFEFLYSVYNLSGTDAEDISFAIEKIYELRDSYSNIEVLSEENKKKVLSILNTKYETQFSFADIWTSRTTTHNQFNYFKNHILVFDDLFESPNSAVIKRKDGAKFLIENYLNLNSNIELLKLDEIALEYKKNRI